MRVSKSNSMDTWSFLIRQAIFLLPLLTALICIELLWRQGSLVFTFQRMRGENVIFSLIMSYISNYGNIALYCVYGIYLLLAFKRQDTIGKWFVFYYVLFQVTLTLFIVHGFKRTFGRPRPITLMTEWSFFTNQGAYHSLPSGHTAEISAAAGSLAQKAKSLWNVFLWGFFPAGMGVSRVYLGMHHATDVLAGAIVGSITSYAVIYCTLRKKRQIEEESTWEQEQIIS